MHSEAIGVTTLDRRVAAVMTPDNQAIFRGVEAEPDQQLLESLHGIVYGQGRPMKLKRKTINQGAEAKRIRDCISEFADEVADFAGKFLDLHQYDHIDDLIFTGGGSMIPAVRDTLRKRLEEPYGIRKFHWYATESSDVRLHPFPYELSRGSTALGGASVYFDFATRTAPVAG
jgi:Tfp pilus assembly PilM family ATPase